MTGSFEPRPVATIRTVGCRLTPTHAEPEPVDDVEDVEDKAVDEDEVDAKVVTRPRRRSPRTNEDAETK